MSKKRSGSLEDFASQEQAEVYQQNRKIARDLRAARLLAQEREEELALVRKELGLYRDVGLVDPPRWLTPRRKRGDKHYAIPTLFLTDIHWGAKVDPVEVGGVNKFDPEIARLRIRRSSEGAIELCRDYWSGVSYQGVQVNLGGDLLSGLIHEELRETNAEYVTESIMGVMETLVAYLRQLADYFDRVNVAGVAGNHSRLTRKPRSKGRALENYDWLVYQMLAWALREDKRITFQVANAADLHYQVYDVKYCLTHGDQFRGGSGISGALSPLMLGTHRKRKRDAQAGNDWDILVMGHWHHSYFLHDLIVGGSVIGYDEYAYTSNFPMEQPLSALWLTTPERGVTAYYPVQLMDRDQEGW